MTTEIRIPTESEREAVLGVTAVSMNFGPAWVEERGKTLRVDLMRAVFEDGRIVATAGERPFTQWFGGRELEMTGIWGVATVPERRRTGLATAAVTHLLREARGRGEPLSALYPATLRPYRRLGYELAGWYTEHVVRLDDLPHGGGGPVPVEVYEQERDLEDVRACYRRAMAEHNGPVDSRDERWWPERVMANTEVGKIHRAVVARGPEGVEAYASFVQEADPGDLDPAFRANCTHLIATSLEGYAALLDYFRGFRGLGQALRFTGPPADPLAMLVDEQRVKPVWSFRWMLRLLHVPNALEQRGYPPVDGEALFSIEDPQFHENHGPWRVRAVDGKVEVEPAPGARAGTIGIGPLSAMYSGMLSPFDAVRLGLVKRDDPAVPFLARLFSGPAPFMLDFF
jgi:predicted acetyltransferase